MRARLWINSVSRIFLVVFLSFTFSKTSSAQVTETTLFKFGAPGSSAGPQGPLAVDAAGHLYGTTAGGGENFKGTVFQLSPTSTGWTQTVLYSFTGKADGGIPNGGLVFDTAGNLYGTTAIGGRFGGNCTDEGCGTVFQLSPNSDGSWTETVIYSFSGEHDGSAPSGLVFDAAGNLYGTTSGTNSGTVFRLSPTASGWQQTNLHAFGGSDGAIPAGPLTLDDDGNIYGVAGGGNQCGPFPCGVVFKLSLTTQGVWKETLLHNFSGGHDGANPLGGLIRDAAGNFYGATYYGGKPQGCPVKGLALGCGVVFQLSPNSDGSWKETVLHIFTGGRDGGNPAAGLVFDAAGNLVGTTTAGGVKNGINGFGTIFGITKAATGWRGEVLHTFLDGDDGAYSTSGLTLGPDGNLFGVTINGGIKTRVFTKGQGVAFELVESASRSLEVKMEQSCHTLRQPLMALR